jgi:hypothetical protein
MGRGQPCKSHRLLVGLIESTDDRTLTETPWGAQYLTYSLCKLLQLGRDWILTSASHYDWWTVGHYSWCRVDPCKWQLRSCPGVSPSLMRGLFVFCNSLKPFVRMSINYLWFACYTWYSCIYNILIYLYKVSQEECAILREGVPYVKVCRYNPKHLCPK